jgi:hypothetical protein
MRASCTGSKALTKDGGLLSSNGSSEQAAFRGSCPRLGADGGSVNDAIHVNWQK